MARVFDTLHLLDKRYDPPYKREIIIPHPSDMEMEDTSAPVAITLIGSNKHPELVSLCAQLLMDNGWLPFIPSNFLAPVDKSLLFEQYEENEAMYGTQKIRDVRMLHKMIANSTAVYVINFRNYQTIEMHDAVQFAIECNKQIFYMENY